MTVQGQRALVLQEVVAPHQSRPRQDLRCYGVLDPEISPLRDLDLGVEATPVDLAAQAPGPGGTVAGDNADRTGAEADEGVVTVGPVGEKAILEGVDHHCFTPAQVPDQVHHVDDIVEVGASPKGATRRTSGNWRPFAAIWRSLFFWAAISSASGPINWERAPFVWTTGCGPPTTWPGRPTRPYGPAAGCCWNAILP